MGSTIREILKIMHLDSTLDEYDEEDKKNISLWGTSEKPATATSDFHKASDKIRRGNPKENLRLSNVSNN